jgi:hypothetical protein
MKEATAWATKIHSIQKKPIEIKIYDIKQVILGK